MAARAMVDLDVHESVLRKWVKQRGVAPVQAVPGHGQRKPEQREIVRLRRKFAKLQTERDIPKEGRTLLREGSDMKFVFIAKHRALWPVAWLRDARLVSRSSFHAWLTRAPSAGSRNAWS